MSVIVEGIYNDGIVQLKEKKSKNKIPNDSAVLIVFQNNLNKKHFISSAGSWRDIDNEIFEDIINSRKNLNDRSIEF